MVRRQVLAGGLIVWACLVTGLESRSSQSTPIETAEVTGSIVDEHLTPLDEVTVTLVQSGTPNETSRTTQTDASGLFAFDRLPPGDYQLSASMASRQSVLKPVIIRRVPSALRVGLVLASVDAELPLADRTAQEPRPPRQSVTRAPAPTVTQWQPQQGASGVVTGRIRDVVGGVIPGVTVALARQNPVSRAVAVTNAAGDYRFEGVPSGSYALSFTMPGFVEARHGFTLATGETRRVDRTLQVGGASETISVAAASPLIQAQSGQRSFASLAPSGPGQAIVTSALPPDTASYAGVRPSGFVRTGDDPRSTFAADIDTASYTNVRRFLNHGTLPPTAAVRVEEFVNYFPFDYPDPRDGETIGLTSEVGDCPWAPGHKLVLIGAKAKGAQVDSPGRSLVFLVDVSGSMAPAERLPLLKSSLALFVDTLRPDDEVSIVTYAGTSGVWLPPTTVRHRDRIQEAIAALHAGGSTNGHAGLSLAYRLARQQFIPGGVNRVMLATDGDFNVGTTANLDLQRFIERERGSGIFLSILGVGTNNLQDDRMEMLADKGNGHYAYLDSLSEARRVLVRDAASTLETVAQDVKFQVEFNPALVQGWRLVGYENRTLRHEQFNDDREDGGELGDGDTVTVLYEIVPVGAAWPEPSSGTSHPPVDALVYQNAGTPSAAARRGEWLTVGVRYQAPGGSVSRLVSHAVRSTGTRGRALPLAAAVAEFGQLLREAAPMADRWTNLLAEVRAFDTGPDGIGNERAGFAEVVELAAGLKRIERPRPSSR